MSPLGKALLEGMAGFTTTIALFVWGFVIILVLALGVMAHEIDGDFARTIFVWKLVQALTMSLGLGVVFGALGFHLGRGDQ